MHVRTKNALLVLAVSLVCVALLEVVAALMFKRAPMNSGKRLVLSAVEHGGRYTWVRDGLVIPHPYLLYVARPGYQEFGFTQVNSLGYRGHEIAHDKPAGTYRILCLGGSTTFSFPFIFKGLDIVPKMSPRSSRDCPSPRPDVVPIRFLAAGPAALNLCRITSQPADDGQ